MSVHAVLPRELCRQLVKVSRRKLKGMEGRSRHNLVGSGRPISHIGPHIQDHPRLHGNDPPKQQTLAVSGKVVGVAITVTDVASSELIEGATETAKIHDMETGWLRVERRIWDSGASQGLTEQTDALPKEAVAQLGP